VIWKGISTGVDAPSPEKKSIFDLKMATLYVNSGQYFYSSAIWFKCKSVVSQVKSTAQPAY